MSRESRTDRPLAKLSRAEAEALARNCGSDELIAALAGTEIEGSALPTRFIRIERGLLDTIEDHVEEVLGPGRRAVAVMDRHTRAAAGEAVLARMPRIEAIELEPLPGWDQLTPHDCFVEQVIERAREYDALIAVGSGTINDITKYAAHQLGKPCIAVATAPSMNGYTSNIAALLVNGLKHTLPCSPSVAVLADVDVLARAPVEMVRSGYADLLSKPVSTADWKLASLVLGEPFSELPSLVVNAAIESCIRNAKAIGEREPEAVAELMKSLILSGFSMAIAGSSAPASGGEHLISHYLDMTAYSQGRSPALHGLQVGLGTLLCARLYELLQRQPPDTFGLVREDLETKQAAHGALWPAIAAEAGKQILSQKEAAARLAKIQANIETIWTELDQFLRPAREIQQNLAAAGVPVCPEELHISPELLGQALLHAADIRARYTVLHFARDLGLLDKLATNILASEF